MQRLNGVATAAATGKAKLLLDGVQAKLGMTPNMMTTMAAAPAALEAYLNFSGALSHGSLDAKMRELIALTVAQANGCEYCLSAHTAIGGMVGLRAEELAASRRAESEEARRAAGLRFAQLLVVTRGEVSDQAMAEVRAAGYSDGEIAEIVANVAINIFTNYFNLVAGTEVDFPRVGVRLEEVAG
jgi:uncharacterized peroxidase-related enzyme